MDKEICGKYYVYKLTTGLKTRSTIAPATSAMKTIRIMMKN